MTVLGEICGLGSVSEVVFQVLDVLQRVEGLVLDLPATASRAGQFAGVMRIERQIGDPGERPPRILAGATPLRTLQHLYLQVGVRSIQFRLRHHAQLAIPLLPFGRGIRKPRRIGTIQLSLQMRMVAPMAFV